MANLITQSLTWAKQDALQFFFKPLFVGDDIRSMITVDTDVQGTKKLDFLSKLEKITKAYQTGAAFTSSTGVTLTQKDIVVSKMKAEVSQSGSAFFNSVKEMVLKPGVYWDDVDGTIIGEAIAAIFTAALRSDLVRQMFFGDKTKETLTAGIYTGTLDVDYKEYDGFWTRIIADFVAATIPAAQKVSLNTTTYLNTIAVAQAVTETLASITAGSITLTINGVAYTQAYTASASATAQAWKTANITALAARGIAVTGGAAALTFTSTRPGMGFTLVETDAGTNGTWTASATTANVSATTLKTDATLTAFQAMYKAMPPVLRSYAASNMNQNGNAPSTGQIPGELRFIITSSMADNFRETLEHQSGSEGAYFTLQNGTTLMKWRGIPIIERPEWDAIIANDFAGVYPHRALLTVPKNLVLGADGRDEDMIFESFYFQKEQANYLRAQYKVGTQYIHPELIVAAY